MKTKVKVKRPKLLAACCAAVCCVAVAVGVALYVQRSPEPQPGANAYVDPNAEDWEVQVDTPEETELGKMLIPGYGGATMREGDAVLSLRVGNPEDNTCYLKATLKLEDGTVLYESGLLEPGKGFEQIPLNQTLAAGVYQAVVHYQGYTMEEQPQAMNSCDCAFTLTVLE